MFGRAGRNGCSARGHLFFTNKQSRQVTDSSLHCFASEASRENCRRQNMLKYLGSAEPVSTGATCCDICSGGVVPVARLNLLVPTPLKRATKSRTVRFIDNSMEEALRHALIRERENFLLESPGFRMLGGSFAVPDATIRELCLKAPVITSQDELGEILSLRPEYHHRFFSVMWDVIASAPPPQRKRRRV